MKNLFSLFTLLVLICNSRVFAARVDTVTIYSNSMHKAIRCVVITPNTYKVKRSTFPVVYLLHGYGGDFRNWITLVPELKEFADKYREILVCPDGATASWYFDSPVDNTMRYETYIGKEVPHYIDSAYRTVANKYHRAITGLSMGGHGALFIAWRHPNMFASAGSMSGGVDLKGSVHRFEIEKVLGDRTRYTANWYNNSIVNLVENKSASPLSLIIDCGADDIFIAENRKLHEKLLALKVDHTYIERPGNHSWNYWKYAIDFQLLYFRKLFDAQLHQLTK